MTDSTPNATAAALGEHTVRFAAFLAPVAHDLTRDVPQEPHGNEPPLGGTSAGPGMADAAATDNYSDFDDQQEATPHQANIAVQPKKKYTKRNDGIRNGGEGAPLIDKRQDEEDERELKHKRPHHQDQPNDEPTKKKHHKHHHKKHGKKQYQSLLDEEDDVHDKPTSVSHSSSEQQQARGNRGDGQESPPLPYDQCFLQDEDDVQHGAIINLPRRDYDDDEAAAMAAYMDASQDDRQQQQQMPPAAAAAAPAPPVNMDVPDDKLTKAQVVARKNFDGMKADEGKFNPPKPIRRDERYTDLSCGIIRKRKLRDSNLDDVDAVRHEKETAIDEGEAAAQDAPDGNRAIYDDQEESEELQHTRRLVMDLHARFFPRGIEDKPCPDYMLAMQDALTLYSIVDGHTPSVEELDDKYGALFNECMQVFSAVQQFDLLKDFEIDSRVRRILDRLKVSRELLGMMFANAKCATPYGLAGEVSQDKDDHALWRFANRDEVDEDYTSFQSLLIYLIDRARELGYRRYRDSMMLPIRTVKGVATGAWKAVKNFQEYVLDITSTKMVNHGMWYHLTKDKGNLKAAVEYLGYSKDAEIPWLKPDRHIFCFVDGMYMAKEERFVPYDDFSKVFPYGPPVACNFFDVPFDYVSVFSKDDYMDIPTPAFDQILDSQNLSLTLKRWVYALFIGRMLYNVGELDDYQIHPFVKGMGGTGKSKLLEAISQLYDKQDIGIIPNNIEEKFGLSPIANKFIAIADDVRKNLKLDQSDFQNMASGNMVSCPVKHKDPLIIHHWSCDVVWSGNEVPDFHDNAGSYSRRLVVLLFDVFIQHPDMTLGERLKLELPNLIVKGNWAYRNILRRYGSKKGIWEIIPREFKEQRNELATGTHALVNFFNSGAMVFGPDKYMPMSTLRDMVMEHAHKAGFSTPRWNADYYRGPFTLFHVKAETKKMIWPKNQEPQRDRDGHIINKKKRLNTCFAVGCEVSTAPDKDEDYDDDDNGDGDNGGADHVDAAVDVDRQQQTR